jgi:low affinity Fe/Cu permease
MADPTPEPPAEATLVTRTIGQITGWLGSFPAILGSVLIIVVWALTGPMLDYSDTWQLVINTGTTIVTFNMVFIIQNTQNRDGRAMQAKLDAQSQAIGDILHSLQLSAQREQELHRLIGIEEAPERTIRDEQDRVRGEEDPEIRVDGSTNASPSGPSSVPR